MSAGEVDGVPDIIGLSTECNQGGSSLRVGVPIIDAPRCLITGVRWKNKNALQLGAELLESVRINLAAVADFELTVGCSESQRRGCSENLLKEVATTLPSVNIHR
jgi:hypothetical protein